MYKYLLFVLMVLSNTAICFIVSANLFFMLIEKGMRKQNAFLLSIVCSIITYLYISLNHKVRNLVEGEMKK